MWHQRPRICHSLLVLAVASSLLPTARADILDQRCSDGWSYFSCQEYTDLRTFSTYMFAKITPSEPGWIVDKVTIYGKELGNPDLNEGVNLAIVPFPDFRLVDQIYCGYEDADGNLVFENLNLGLEPDHTYWLTAFVVRSYLEGRQWYWWSAAIQDSEAYFHNPGGGHGWGTEPFPLSAHMRRSDLALRVEGRRSDGDLAIAVPSVRSSR